MLQMKSQKLIRVTVTKDITVQIPLTLIVMMGDMRESLLLRTGLVLTTVSQTLII